MPAPALTGLDTVDVAHALPFWLLPLGVLTLVALGASWLLGRKHARPRPAESAAPAHEGP